VRLARLSPREQRLVAVFGALLGGVLVWSLVLSPILNGRDGVRREIDSLRAEIPALDGLARQIRQVKAERPDGHKAPAVPADFSVLGFIEKAAGASLRPESITSMSPSRRPIEGGRQESTVEIKLSGVALGEIVALLQAVEDETSPVYVKQFHVKKRYDDASRFDVTLVAAASLPG
jgi:type II secretory pathway component PulM